MTTLVNSLITPISQVKMLKPGERFRLVPMYIASGQEELETPDAKYRPLSTVLNYPSVHTHQGGEVRQMEGTRGDLLL